MLCSNFRRPLLSAGAFGARHASQDSWFKSGATFKDVGVHDPVLLAQLKRFGFSVPSAIQAAALPKACAGRDVLVLAQTGTGKTFTFTLPIIQDLLQASTAGEEPPLSCVMLPTAELAEQTAEVFQHLIPTASVLAACSKVPQGCAGGAHIAVGTPAGLLSAVQGVPRPVAHLALDEVDALAASFKAEVGSMVAHVRGVNGGGQGRAGCLPGCQVLLAGATLRGGRSKGAFAWLRQTFPSASTVLGDAVHSHVPGVNLHTVTIDVDALAAHSQHDLPHRVEEAKHRALLKALAAQGTEAAAVLRADLASGHVAMTAAAAEAREGDALAAASGEVSVLQTLVFVDSYEAAEAAASVVEDAVPELRVATLHSRLPPEARAAHAALFASGDVDVLVATDIAARGLDTRRVAHVVQLDVPKDLEVHLHRSGRTARAGAGGTVTLVVPSHQSQDVQRIFSELGAAPAPEAAHGASQKAQRKARARKAGQQRTR